MDTTKTDEAATRVPRNHPTVKLLFSAGIQQRTLSLGSRPLFIGRDLGDADGIEIEHDERASRRHAVISLGQRPRGGREEGTPPITISDLGSKNGLFVNGGRVEKRDLRDGDIIRLGGSLLLLRFEPAEPGDDSDCALQGLSPAICELRRRLHRAARTHGAVLLVGETGTGKDLSASILHRWSDRAVGPLIHINTSAIPESLAEGQLFGHRRGSFTGAKDDHIGVFEQAHGGTLFLNEIGDMSLANQAKILSAIERKEVVPVGGRQAVRCDTRVVAATNRDLPLMIRRGQFREDLYERLKGTLVTLPPLRQRQEDILGLLHSALLKHGAPATMQFTARLAEALLLHSWPGNVRELLNIAQAVAPEADPDEPLDLEQVQEHLRIAEPGGESEAEDADQEATASVEIGSGELRNFNPSSTDHAEPVNRQPRLSAEALRRLWEETGNVSRFAARVGRSRRQARRWLEDLGLRKK